MRQMKDSGIEWIGEIPVEWTLSKIGSMYNERKQKVSDRDYAPLSVTMKGIVPQLSTAAKTDSHDDRKLVLKGDFAINSRSDRRGSCGISKYDGSVSLINIILAPKQDMNPEYYDWLFHTSMFADEYYKWGHGIVDDLWTTGWQDMKSIVVPCPDLSEQQAIATFLDKKCTEIDNAISKTTASIEEYKKLKQAIITKAVTKGIRGNRPMKDSRIEWIGEIPSDWKIEKIKYVALFSPPCDKTGILVDTVVTYLPMECVKNGKYISNTKEFGKLSTSLNEFQDGDIIMAKVTPCFENGNIAILEGIESGYGVGSSELFVYRPTRIVGKFLFYWLRNSFFMDMGCATMTGTGGLKRVNPYYVRNCEIHYPPEIEQREIAAYLDGKCYELDNIITKKQQLITELEAYKKSLIYEYVTGKKEVV